MSIARSIHDKLTRGLAPQHLDIINESHRHAGAATESHFKLVVVADAFSGLGPVKRHQTLYRLLAEELAGPVHALALHAYTPEEWRASGEAPPSPACRGGSKDVKVK